METIFYIDNLSSVLFKRSNEKFNELFVLNLHFPLLFVLRNFFDTFDKNNRTVFGDSNNVLPPFENFKSPEILHEDRSHHENQK